MSVPLSADPTAKKAEQSRITARPNETDAMGIEAIDDSQAKRMELTTPDADWIRDNQIRDVTAPNQVPQSHKHHVPYLHHRRKDVPEVRAIDMVDQDAKPSHSPPDEKAPHSLKDKLKGLGCTRNKHSEE